MAQTVRVELSDDIDGTTRNVETISFALEGARYEVDLSSRNAAKLRDASFALYQAGRDHADRGNFGVNEVQPRIVTAAPGAST